MSLQDIFRILTLIVSVSVSSCSGNLSQSSLLEDEFDTLPAGYIYPYSGTSTEYHYVPGSGQAGPWAISTFTREEAYRTAWEIVQGEDGNYLRQNSRTVDARLQQNYRHIHPMIVAGDSIWHDYKIEFEFSPGELLDKCGVVFRYQDDRSYYYYGMEGNHVVIKMVRHATAPGRPFEKILAAQEYDWKRGERYNVDISIRENKIYTLLNDSLILIANDDAYKTGKIGILSDVPADFYKLEVKTLNREKRKINRYKTLVAKERSMRISENSKPVLWKKIGTPGFGTGRNLRFGDLNRDGELDVLIAQVEAKKSGEQSLELNCLSAMTFDGELLWQKGRPQKHDSGLVGDAAVQIHDLDDDGAREVIYAQGIYLFVAEGKTGKVMMRKKIPVTGQDRIEQHSSLNIYFCDIQGKGRDSNLILGRGSDYHVYDEHLRLLWSVHASSGKYPVSMDVDGDSKDELLIGYTLFDDDGSVIWKNDNSFGDDVEGSSLLLSDDHGDSTITAVYAAGDWGLVILSSEGNVIKHHPIGHTSHISVANFRSDLPGLEMISSNYWGSQGIIHLFDANGEIIFSFEPGQYGSLCLPVNWKGDGEEYFLLNTNPGDGGLFNASGQLCVAMPDDGHPDLCSAVLDVTGDERDELITWDQNQIWVYSQEDSPRQGRNYYPERNPLYNCSNYQVNVSIPNWSE